MWIQHLFSFIGTILHIFFDAIGSTLLGRLVDIAFGASIAIAVLLKTKREQGWRPMLKHWQEEYRSALKFSMWCALIIYGPILVWAIGKAVYEDHLGLVTRSRIQRSSIRDNASLLQTTKDELGGQVSDWKAKCAGFEGTNGALTGQNRDQQNTINHCQENAIKLLAPALQKTTPIVIGKVDAGPGLVKIFSVLLTNKPVSPVDMFFKCDRAITSFAVYPIPKTPHMATMSPVNQFTWEARINNPPWTQEAPLMTEVTYQGTADEKLNGVCEVDVR
jgi:hypothetical protein